MVSSFLKIESRGVRRAAGDAVVCDDIREADYARRGRMGIKRLQRGLTPDDADAHSTASTHVRTQ